MRSTSTPSRRRGPGLAALAVAGAFVAGAAVSAAAEPFTRPLSTDRPDQTESPYTLEPGHWQIEFQAVSFAGDGDGLVSSSQWLGANVKAGLTPRLDVQAITTGLQRVSVEGNGDETGIGDLITRLKWNLVGNDDPGAAVALLPYVSWPIGADAFTADGVEGGLIATAAFPLGGPWGLGAMVQGDVARDADGDGTHGEWLFTSSLSRSLGGPLGAFVEHAVRSRPSAEGDREGYLDVGGTYGLGPDRQLDAGAQFGLTDASEDWRIFLGFTIRR